MTKQANSPDKLPTKIFDKAKAVRAGEELPTEQIHQWLRANVDSLMLSEQQLPVVTQYAGGASNWTYCLEYPEQSLILRRAPRGTKAKGAHNMAREFQLQQALKLVFPYVPEMIAFCNDNAVLDSDFYVMEKLNGIIPRKNMPRDLSLSPAKTHQLCTNVLDCLVELHQVDIEKAGLTHLGKGKGYVQRQVDGWSQRYSQAKTWNVPSGKKVMRWLKDNMPSDERICLTHNDFRFDNVVLDGNDPTKVIGILDWELATLGDPLMDLGNSLAYWVEADDDFMAQMSRRQPTHLQGMLTRQQVIEYYCQKMAVSVEEFTFYEVFGLFRLAGIVQQIYYRYHHKQTNNPAFKRFWLFSHYLLWRCNQAIKKQGKARG